MMRERGAATVVLAALAVAGSVLSAPPVYPEGGRRKPITMELVRLVEKSPEVGSMLEASIAEAKKANPDLKTNPVQSLEQYYDFIDRASELVPQEVLDHPADLTRHQILQSICYFYFLVDQPLPELENKGLFDNTIQYYGPFSTWLGHFADAWGAFLDTEHSWGSHFYREFSKDPRFGLQRGWYEDPARWKTFNQFFSRHLKSPAMRPIASPEDGSVVTSPADSVPQGIWAIDGDSNILVPGGLKVKLATYFNIEDLLGEKSAYKAAFAHGILTHTFLNVNDYHRYHFAVGGTVKEMAVLQRNVALEVAWSPREKQYVPIDSTGWQFSQTLGYVIVDTGKYGLVALVPMGMAQVSSVNFEKGITVGSAHQKGDMLGTFLFGGSDFVMLFQKDAGFDLTAPAEHHFLTRSDADHAHLVKTYKHILMGEKYGVMKGGAK
jgi:phosphatidylserine decarboxylase